MKAPAQSQKRKSPTANAEQMYTYFAYGLEISSDLQLAGLPECQIRASGVTIAERGIDPDAVAGDSFRNWRASPGKILIELIGEARILVEEGQRISYERLSGADNVHLGSTIMGTGLAAILLQRETLPLHACCVKTDSGAVLVMGKSGAGKSTTLTGLLEAGYAMMADDVTAVRLEPDNQPKAIPAFPSVRVWQDVLEQNEVDYSVLDRVHPDMAKYFLPVEQFHAQSEPIAGIVYLVASNRAQPFVESLEPKRSIEPLRRMIYRKNFLKPFGLELMAFRYVATLAQRVPFIRFERPTSGITPVEVARHMLGALGI